MPNTPVRLTVPAQCPKCGASHDIYPMPLVGGPVVELCWFCQACHHEWPIVRRDQTESELVQPEKH